MNKDLLSLVQHELDQGGATDTAVFDLGAGSALADYIIVTSGTSTRHVASLAVRLADELKTQKKIVSTIEGLPDGNWVLVDGGDIIIHLFRPEVRAYYQIEELWAERAAEDAAEEPPLAAESALT